MCGGVYGPADHLQVAFSRLLQKVGRQEIAAHRDLPRANLDRFLERVLNLAVEKQAGHQRRLNPAKAGKNCGVKRDDDNPGDFRGIAKRADQNVFPAPKAAWFEFQVENDIVFSGKLEDLLQRGNAFSREITREPCARVELPDLRHGQIVNGSTTIGGPIDGLVVNGHKVRIAGQSEVGLYKGYALRESAAKGGKSVFRRITGSTTMGNGEHVAGFLREQSGGYKTGRARDAMSYATTERPLRSRVWWRVLREAK